MEYLFRKIITMKHLLNDLSNEEKNRIREQYEGGITVDPSRFKNLMESKLGNVKPLISEEPEDTSADYEKYSKLLSGGTSGQTVNNTQSVYDQWTKFFGSVSGQSANQTNLMVPSFTRDFQDYMDTIGPWVKTKTGQYVKLNKGKGYGTIGPNTFEAWKKYGKQFLDKNKENLNNYFSKNTTQTTTTNPNIF